MKSEERDDSAGGRGLPSLSPDCTGHLFCKYHEHYLAPFSLLRLAGFVDGPTCWGIRTPELDYSTSFKMLPLLMLDHLLAANISPVGWLDGGFYTSLP